MKPQRGNILFLILLAVVLFAALTYAVTGGQRVQATGALPPEKVKSYAAMLLQYGALVESTVNRMVLSGIPVEQLDFGGTYGFENSTNTACQSGACKIFQKSSAGGGGLNGFVVPYDATDHTVSSPATNSAGEGLMIANTMSIKGVGTGAVDATITFRSIRPEICDYINEIEGVTKPGEARPTHALGTNGTTFGNFEGAMDPWPVYTADYLGSLDARLVGHRVFCITRTGAKGHYLYYVIYSR